MNNSQEKHPLLKKEVLVPLVCSATIALCGFVFGRRIGRNEGATALAMKVLDKDPDLAVNVYKALNNK